MASSSGEDVPRGLEFLLSRNRLNVAISRARCLAYLVASPRLLEVNCRTIAADAARERALPLRRARALSELARRSAACLWTSCHRRWHRHVTGSLVPSRHEIAAPPTVRSDLRARRRAVRKAGEEFPGRRRASALLERLRGRARASRALARHAAARSRRGGSRRGDGQARSRGRGRGPAGAAMTPATLEDGRRARGRARSRRDT